MKQKNLIITGAIFVVLLVYVLFTQTGNRGFNTLKLPSVPTITSDEMEKISMNRLGEKVVLAKQGEEWQIVEPFKFLADKSKVDALRRMLEEFRITNMVSDRSDAKADFGLNSLNAIGLSIQAGKKKIDVTLGAANNGNTHTYAQLPEDTKVYQVLGDFTQQLKYASKDWRSLRVYEFSTDVVKSVSITRKGKPELAFSKQEEVQPGIVTGNAQNVSQTVLPSKMVWKEKETGLVLSDPNVNLWLNNFTRLAAHLINDEAKWEGEPMARIRVETLKNEVYELEILKYLDKDQRYQVRRAGEQLVYEIGRYQGDNILKTLAELK